jgi:uncharacterized protein
MNQRVISVQGRGTVRAEPDLVQLSFSISVLDQEYDVAMARLNDRVNQLRQDVATVDVDPKELKTTNFNISPKHYWSEEEEEQVFLGFEAEHDLRLELPLDQDLLNRALVQLAESASQATFSIYFAVKDQDALRQRVLANAVARARENAETLAQAAGVQLGEILRIEYGWAEVRFSERMMTYEASEMPTSPMPDIQPDEIEAGDNVTVIWAIG